MGCLLGQKLKVQRYLSDEGPVLKYGDEANAKLRNFFLNLHRTLSQQFTLQLGCCTMPVPLSMYQPEIIIEIFAGKRAGMSPKLTAVGDGLHSGRPSSGNTI